MKLHTVGLRNGMNEICMAAVLAGAGVLAGTNVVWADSAKVFDNTVKLPTSIYFGWGGAVPVPADYSGDGRTDLALYFESSGMWHVRTMGGTVLTRDFQMGGSGWNACPADYDGDGKADPAVYGNGMLGIAFSSRGYALGGAEFGTSGFTPVPADYDSDGKADPAVYGNGAWTVAFSSRGYEVGRAEFGASGFTPVPADYDADGKADPAIYSRSLGLWMVALSGSGYAVYTHSFNCPDATPVPGDYDGDGKADLAIYHVASGFWLGYLSGSDYALFYQILGGGGYLPVTGRFYHRHSHTLGVYNPSTGEWLVYYTPALVGEGAISGGIFGTILRSLGEGVGHWAVAGAVGWVLDLLTHKDQGDQQVLQQLNAMDTQMTTLLGMTTNLMAQVNSLASQLQLDQTETENYIMGQTAQNAINYITTYCDQTGGDSMATFFSSTFTNTCPDTNTQHMLISQFANNVANGNYPIKKSVTDIHNALMPGGFGEAGLLWGWTTNFILSAATADSLPDYYLTLESYYAYLYTYLMKGASTYVDVEHYLYSNDFNYVSDTLTPAINSEVDQFEQCTYQMLLSKADFANNFSTNAAFVPWIAATNILFRNVFMAAQARGTNAYGLNAMILATMDAMTNGMPPIVAFYNHTPPPRLHQPWSDTIMKTADDRFHYPITSRWISVTGPAYDYWDNGRMHATNKYAFLQYWFGKGLPSQSPYSFGRSKDDIPGYGPSYGYGGIIYLMKYDDTLNACPTGNTYGCYVTQLRKGGPNFFANSGAPYFGTTVYTHQVLGDTSKQGAIMNVTGQYPAGTNVLVVSVVISNGPYDAKHMNEKQGDITVNAHALWSFTYDGQAAAAGALQYKAATSGHYTLNPANSGGGVSEQTDSFAAQIDVFDKTTGSVCANVIVKSFAVNKNTYRDKTTIDFGANTQGALAVTFQPGHEYQVRAGWDCSMHEEKNYAFPYHWIFPYTLDVTLAVQGLAITFE